MFAEIGGIFLILANRNGSNIDCRIYEYGFARLRCPKYPKENLLDFSCNSHLCPSCEQKRMLVFADKVTDDIHLSVPHRFWTFSIPKAIRGILLRDRRLLKLIPRCAFEAVKQAMKETLPRDNAAGEACSHPCHSHRGQPSASESLYSWDR